MFYINNHAADRNYQNKLRDDVRRAYIEIYDNPELVEDYLVRKPITMTLLMMDGDNLSMALAAIQLAQYVAFKEIQVKLYVLINLGHKI